MSVSVVASPRLEPAIRQVSEFRRTIGGNIADLRTPDCAVRSDHSFTSSPYSDKGKFPGDLHAARIMNMSEYALNQSSLRMTLNHRVPGSSPGAPTIQSSRTAETVVDQKHAVSAGILDAYF